MKSVYERAHMAVLLFSERDMITCSDPAPVTDTEPIVLPIHPFSAST